MEEKRLDQCVAGEARQFRNAADRIRGLFCELTGFFQRPADQPRHQADHEECRE